MNDTTALSAATRHCQLVRAAPVCPVLTGRDRVLLQTTRKILGRVILSDPTWASAEVLHTVAAVVTAVADRMDDEAA